MAGNVQRKLTIGIHPLSYLGVNADSPPNSVLLQNQDPTTSDYQNFIIGDIWINENGSPTPPAPRIWMLGALARQSATWIPIASGSGGNVNTIVTDSGTATPILGVIDLFAQTQAGATVKFSASTNVIRLNVTDGSTNTIIGLGAGNSTLTSTASTSLGFNSLHALTSGINNSALGASSGAAITSGANNTTMGSASAAAITTGGQNTIIGSSAAGLLTTGSNNTGLGNAIWNNGAGAGLITGSNNIAIGASAGSLYTAAESSNILVGNTGVNGESHVMRLGTTGTGAGQVNTTFIAGSAVNIPNGSLAVNLSIQTTNGGIVAGSTNVASPAQISCVQSRSGGAVLNGDTLGKFEALGNDGTNPAVGGIMILGVVTGAVSAGIVPTDMQFWTTNAAGTQTQRMSISKAGNVGVLAADSGVSFTSAGSVAAGGDEGGTALYNTFTNGNSTTISTGTGTVKMSSTNNANNAAWIKIYIGTTAYWIPAWTTNSP